MAQNHPYQFTANGFGRHNANLVAALLMKAAQTQQQQQQPQQRLAYVSPSTSSTNLSQQDLYLLLQRQQQQAQRQASLSPPPVKKRKLSGLDGAASNAAAEQSPYNREDESVRRLNALAELATSELVSSSSSKPIVPQQEQDQEQRPSSPEASVSTTSAPSSPPRSCPLKKRKMVTLEATAVAVASTTQPALVPQEESDNEDESRVRRRKELAAKLRADNVAGKLVLKPSAFVRSIFHKNSKGLTPANDLAKASRPTEADVEFHKQHSPELHKFVREGNVAGFKKCIRELVKESGETDTTKFRCCNAYGESLLHLTCRRGRTEMARFLLEGMHQDENEENLDDSSSSFSSTASANETARKVIAASIDDYNKTPLHDACWTAEPNYELVDLLLRHAPEQVMMKDVRGNTPFDYVRSEDNNSWLKFLWNRRTLLRCRSLN